GPDRGHSAGSRHQFTDCAGQSLLAVYRLFPPSRQRIQLLPVHHKDTVAKASPRTANWVRTLVNNPPDAIVIVCDGPRAVIAHASGNESFTVTPCGQVTEIPQVQWAI